MLLDKAFKMKELFGADKFGSVAGQDMALIEKISVHMEKIQTLTEKMIEARKVANKIASERKKAIAYHDTVAVAFDEIRYHADKLEEVVDQRNVAAAEIQGVAIRTLVVFNPRCGGCEKTLRRNYRQKA